MTKPKVTREQWLNNAAAALRPLFVKAKFKVPTNIRLTCGFPHKGAFGKKQRIGECWSDKSSAGKVFEIFISPVQFKAERILRTVAHELAHAIVGLDKKHGAPFKHCLAGVDLQYSAATSTVGGADWHKSADATLKKLGAYPHQELKYSTSEKKQTTRLIKASCGGCEYTIRITRAWIDAVGLPCCPACEEELEEAA